MEEEKGKSISEEILAFQIEEVQKFGPERILSPEVREPIVEAITSGLDIIATTIKEQVEEGSGDYDGLTRTMEWGWVDFIRTILTSPPLPPQAFQLEDSATPEEIQESSVADEQDWWEVLNGEQKVAIWTILKEDFGLSESLSRESIRFLPRRGFRHTIARSAKIITVPAAQEQPENQFQAAVVFDPQRQPCYLTCYVVK